ncbi:MAG TPA: hypothetical protein VIG64_01655 [Actinomycetota bacterium]|jgi:hypothetical protein
MRARQNVKTIVFATALVMASCSSSGGSSTAATDAAESSASQRSAETGSRAATAGPGPGSEVGVPTTGALPSPIPSTGANDGGGSGPSGAGKGTDGKLPPPGLPSNQDVVPIRAAVTPACVERGRTATIEVKTKPKGALGWQAVYSDGLGGSDPPFGGGYGGNDKGFASEQGTYSATWVVSPTAPAGRGRVDVVVGYRGEFGYDGPHFAVADDEGNCPEAWLRGKD